MQQLSGVDASFLYFDTPKVPGHIFSVYVYDQSTAPKGAVTFKGILSHVEHRLPGSDSRVLDELRRRRRGDGFERCKERPSLALDGLELGERVV